MRLILGQFTRAELHAFQIACQEAQRYQQHIIMPYFGDPVQVIELSRRRQLRKSISIQAHTA